MQTTQTESNDIISRLTGNRNQIRASFWRHAEMYANDPTDEAERDLRGKLLRIMDALEQTEKNLRRAKRDNY